jgi:CRP/FNR family transcriptional regulator
LSTPSIDDLPPLRDLPVLAFPAGQLLFDETRACLGFPLLSQGSIKVCKAFPNGRELLLYQVSPGETCVVSAACLFSGLPYSARAITRSEVRLKLIPPPLFDRLMEGALFRRFVMGQFTQRLSDLMALVDAIFTHRLDQRLAARLLAHRAEAGDVLGLTHQQLADELGSMREVVSRLLKQFEGEGWISIERGAIRVLALDQLHALSTAAG